MTFIFLRVSDKIGSSRVVNLRSKTNRMADFNFLNSLIDINFNSSAVWLGVILTIILFAVISFILSYHWRKYGFETFVMAKAALWYFSVSAVLFSVMIISLTIYLGSI